MKGYSLSRVAQYARYHYISQSKSYLSLLFTMFAMPALIGILSRSMHDVPGISMAIYLFGGIGFAVRTTFSMRERTSKVREMTLPVSAEERMTFMFFNLAVAYPLACLITASLAIVVTYPFSYSREIGAVFEELLSSGFFEWPIYIIVQIIASSSLLINILARRNLFVAYLGAFAGVVTFLAITGRALVEILENFDDQLQYVNVYIPEPVAITLFCLVPVVIYAFAYLALRRRQMKW
ncbi:MAG: hypothetical protein IKL43_03140 [Alistipes sp.]|nr:hypothetical protein [Alistipes sp.]